MPKYIGSKLLKARYVGTQAITKIYRGASLVWGAIKEALAQISGKSMTLVNCTREESLNDFNIYGKSEQAKYQGYQQLDDALLSKGTITVSGCTAEYIGNGEYKLNGDFPITANFNFVGSYDTSTPFFYLPAGTYTTNCRLHNYDGTTRETFAGPVYGSAFGTLTTFTLTSEKPVTWVTFPQHSARTYTDDVYHPFINKGNVNIIEPYVGGIPSPSPSYPQSIESVVEPVTTFSGVNLLPPTTRYDEYIPCDFPSGTAFTWGTNEPIEYGGNFRFWDETKTQNSWFGVTQGTDGATTTVHFRVRYIQDLLYATQDRTKVSLVVGREKIVEPYHEPQTYTFPHTLYGIPVSSGGNYTDESGQQWIADYVDVENKKLWHLVRAYRIDGTEVVLHEATTPTLYRVDFAIPNVKVGSNYAISTHFNYKYVQFQGCFFISAVTENRMGFCFYLDVAKDLNEAISWLANNECLVYYETTPYSEDLTDAEIEAFKQLKTFKPTTIVTNNFDAHMSTSYHTKLEELDAQLINLYNSDIKEITT